MKAIVLFDTLYGNTEKIANSLARGLQEAGVESESVNIKAARIDRLVDFDLLTMGAPTQYFTASKPVKEFVERLKGLDLKGKGGFAFDTKLDSRLSGSAAKFIEKKLEKKLQELGLEIIRPRSSAIVIGQKKGDKIGEAVLKEGMEELFKQIGKELGTLLKSTQQKVRFAMV